MRKNALLLRASLLTLLCLTAYAAQSEEPGLTGWYQVDVIIFKPRNVDLDEESWPEFKPSYPADVLSIDAADVFKLSQLESLDSDVSIEEEQADASGTGDFVFASRSRGAQNRRIIESIKATDASPLSEVSTNSQPGTELITQDGTPATSADSSGIGESDDFSSTTIDEILASLNPISPGKLAFSDASDTSSIISVLRSLRRSSRFTVLDNYSWIAPINNEPTTIMVQTGQRYDDRFEIEGTLTFNRSRFLHVNSDLWYTVFEPRGTEANPYLGAFESGLSDELLTEYPELVKVERERGQYYAARTHQMKQSRRMRSGELHYLDHPLFGIVVRINRHTIELE